jgi:2-(1,2-epoxy-1,2-dihydrophenyl)acetyl-CoA isomerase
MRYKNIILKKEERVATITLNRPEKLNALTVPMFDELAQACGEVGEDDEVRVVIITGAGKGFCSGADLNSPDFRPESLEACQELMEKIRRVVMGIRNIPKPVIAAVNGVAIGGGCNLALACDIILASDKARFSQPYVQRGIHPDFGGIYFLPRLIGLAKASNLLLTGRVIDASEADRIGLVSRVVPANQLEDVTRELAIALAKSPPLAMRMTRDSIHQALMMDLPEALDCETKAQSILSLTEDHREAIDAFNEKREPFFKGK